MTSLALLAGAGAASGDDIDQYEVRRLVEAGKVQPLERLLAQHRDRLQGRIIDLELEHEHGVLVYEIELVDGEGRVREYLIDAQSGAWLGEE